VERGEHLVLVGPNGAGKTTLIETLAGVKEPAEGSVRTGHNVKIGYLSQHADSAAGDGTVLEAAARETGLAGQKVRDLLGGFLFSGADANKQLRDISGGEQRRLSLAILVASGANVLILDEPTNHLDIESREALEDALGAFAGAVILISHDRALLEAVGSRTIVCEAGELRSYPVGWATYQRDRDEEETPVAAGSKPSGGEDKRRRASGPSNNARRKVVRLQERIEKAEADLRDLEEELADPGAWSSPTQAERAGERHAAAKLAVAELYEQWEAAEAKSQVGGSS
jgi:ATP-binding cassette, subfamily F, member 3